MDNAWTIFNANGGDTYRVLREANFANAFFIRYIFDLGGYSDRGCPAAIPLSTGETIPSPLDGGDACV